MITPQRKAKIDRNFTDQLQQLQDHAKTFYENLQGNVNSPWCSPVKMPSPPSGGDSPRPDWDDDLFKVEEMPDRFQAHEAYQSLLKAVEDSGSPGVTGDIISCQLMTEYMWVLQRAFVARHTSFSRNLAFVASRMRGLGSSTGPLAASVKDVITNIQAQSS